MNTAIVTGEVESNVKVINTKNGTPFCRFTLLADGRKFNCLIAGKKAFGFVYEVKMGSEITIESVINDRNQLVVQKFKVLNPPNYFGQVFDYKGHKMPHKKVMF
ncbi:MAG: ssDNA-binding protein [Desemzia incerta]